MRITIRNILSISALVLLCISVQGQELQQRAARSSYGGKWWSSGNLTGFSIAGQPAVSSRMVAADTSKHLTGTVGFIGPTFSLEPNNPPVAVAPLQEIAYELGQTLILEGFDPDEDPIKYQILSQPTQGTVALVEGTANEYIFTPAAGLQPDVLYKDVLTFKVVEAGGQMLSSNIAEVRFAFKVNDVPQIIRDLTFDHTNGQFELIWSDQVLNKSYGVQIQYYDLTDISNPKMKQLHSGSDVTSAFLTGDTTLAYKTTVSSTEHPFLFGNNVLFFTALVTTPNGNSSFFTQVINNSGGNRTSASDDGLFFAFGSDMTVMENKEVTLDLIAVELGSFSLTNSTMEILKVATSGSLTAATLSGTTANTKTWKVTFKSEKEVGGLDSIQFRVFHAERNVFDTAWARIDVKDVNDAPKVTKIGNQRTTEELAFTVPLKYVDPDNEVDILVESNETSKVSASYANGMITITPSKDYSGLVSVNVIITEKGTEEQYVAFTRFDVVVEPVNDPPVMAAINAQTILEDNSLSLVLSATDVDAKLQVFDYFVEIDQPALFTITVDGNGAKIVPKANVNGTFTVKVYADDRQGTTTSRSTASTFTLNITPVNDAPTVVKAFTSQKIVQGLPAYTLDLAAYFTDVESASSLTYTASGNTLVGLTFSGSKMTVAADASFSTVEDVVITASDGSLSVSSPVTFVAVTQSTELVVANAPGTISVNEDFGTTTIDLSQVFSVTNNPSAVITYDIIGGNFIDATIDAATGILTLKSSADYFGNESFFLVASTNGQSKFENLAVTVNSVNDKPVVSKVSTQLMQEDLKLENLFVGASDVDNTIDQLTMTFKSLNPELVAVSGITAQLTSGGFLVSIDPIANQNGVAEIWVYLSDQSLKDSTKLTVHVQAINDKPTATASTVTNATEDVLYQFDVTSLFTDIEGDELTFDASTLPDWATFSSPLIIGTPTNDDVAVWSMVIVADDGNGGSASATYSLTVDNVNDAPEVVSQVSAITALQENNWTYEFPKSSFKDIDAGDVLTYSFDTYPSWATVSGTTLSGKPGYSDIGQYDLIMSVTDKAGAKATISTKVTVQFTIYDVTVTVSVAAECNNKKKSVTAAGAVTYNWYDSNNNLIGAKQQSLILDPGTYSIEGVDAAGHTTPSKVTFQVEACLVLGVDEPQIEIYPNPTTEWLNIDFISPSASVLVFDALGRRYQLPMVQKSNGLKLDMSSLPSGMYFIKSDALKEIYKVIRRD